MNTHAFTKALADTWPHPLLADGAFGSFALALYPRGAAVWSGKSPCVELLNLILPSTVIDIHTVYLKAGARLIHTNTTCGDEVMLAVNGHSALVHDVNTQAVNCARKAVRDTGIGALIAGAVGPSYIDPQELARDSHLVSRTYRVQIEALLRARVDLLWIETARNYRQTRLLLEVIASEQARIGVSVPVVLTLSPSSGGSFPAAFSSENLLSLLHEFSISAVGANCGFGITDIEPFLEALASLSDLPLIVVPSAGLPLERENAVIYPIPAEQFAYHMRGYIRRFHPAIIGGCCDTTPEYIRLLHAAVREARTAESRS